MQPVEQVNSPRTFRHRWLLPPAAILTSIALCLILAEAVLRFFPVPTGLTSMPVNAANPVFHFQPDQQFVYSRDWNMALANTGHINNAGFVNDRDYDAGDKRPLLAVIGDSYVEAVMVPNNETFYGRLADQLGEHGRLYSFGVSGAPLSQYLIWAQHAARIYRPSGMVFVIVGNDFDESLLATNAKPGFHLYAKGADGILTLKRADYHPGILRNVIRASALARYLLFNLKVHRLPETIRQRFSMFSSTAFAGTPAFIGNTASDTSSQRVVDSYAAIEAFFRDLPTMAGLPPDRINFILDGARYAGDAATTDASYFGLMRRRFMAVATGQGYEVIDMQPRFIEHNRDGKTRFEYPTDGHWNSTAHGLVAQSLASSVLFRRIFAAR
jgi:hypothetical protein